MVIRLTRILRFYWILPLPCILTEVIKYHIISWCCKTLACTSLMYSVLLRGHLVVYLCRSGLLKPTVGHYPSTGWSTCVPLPIYATLVWRKSRWLRHQPKPVPLYHPILGAPSTEASVLDLLGKSESASAEFSSRSWTVGF